MSVTVIRVVFAATIPAINYHKLAEAVPKLSFLSAAEPI
jgi:hypothetical protein